MSDITVKTELSDRVSKDMKKLGFKFVGSTIIYSYLQAIGVVNDLSRVARLGGYGRIKGRNQLVLNLTDANVRDYIVENVGGIIDKCGVDYVKWDCNRHITDILSGEFCHRYILGLYDILDRIFTPRPHVLLESCASGGNRFDLGMLRFSPQIWASDDTDPVERLKIQIGLSYLYPLSAFGAHVSDAPHQQTLRNTPLATRFNVAAFGCLGYELDFKFFSREQRLETSEQIEFYKKYRKVFQFGRFYRGEKRWHVVSDDTKTAISRLFQTLAESSPPSDSLAPLGLDKNKFYRVSTRPQRVFIRSFGGLVKHLMPITLNPDGFILRTVNRFYSLTDCVETYAGYGAALMEGIALNNQFMGSFYNKNTRLLGDFASNLYLFEEVAQ
jgi:alpha-galactosidase